MQRYYQKQPRFDDVYSGINLKEIKVGTYVINHDDYKSIGTHCIAMYENGDKVTSSWVHSKGNWRIHRK